MSGERTALHHIDCAVNALLQGGYAAESCEILDLERTRRTLQEAVYGPPPQRPCRNMQDCADRRASCEKCIARREREPVNLTFESPLKSALRYGRPPTALALDALRAFNKLPSEERILLSAEHAKRRLGFDVVG